MTTTASVSRDIPDIEVGNIDRSLSIERIYDRDQSVKYEQSV